MTALEALPKDLFDQILCLLIVVGIIILLIVSEVKGGGDG